MSSSRPLAFALPGNLLDTQEDVFAVLLDPVGLIDVGCVVVALPALDNILSPVPDTVDRVIAFVTEEHVSTGIAVYAVVTFSTNHRVVASASVEHVSCL